MAELNHDDLEAMAPIDVIGAINTGATIINATFPFIKDLFAKIAELVRSVQTDRLSTPHGKRVAIEELQHDMEVMKAKDALQKELNKLYDQHFHDLGI